MKRGRKPFKRITIKECGYEDVGYKFSSKCTRGPLEAIVRPDNMVAIGKCSSGHIKVLFLSDVEEVLNNYLMKEELTENHDYKDMHIISKAFEEIMKKEKIEITSGSGRSNSVINYFITLPNKYYSYFPRLLLEPIPGAQYDDNILENFNSFNEVEGIHIDNINDIKNALQKIRESKNRGEENIDEKLIELNKKSLAISKEFMDVKVKNFYKEKEKDLKRMLDIYEENKKNNKRAK